ncbi:MAG: cell surface protein SprA [Prevotellaceae bacterium]|jgi:cell surface protein SprA|nr:cell surface protein SprA [Prevotellaceae bacterium]
MKGVYRSVFLFCLCCAATPAWPQTLLPADAPVVEYDPVTKNYLYYHSYDTRHTMPFKVLTSEEYQREQFSNALRNGWAQQRSDGNSGLFGNTGDNLLPSSIRFGIKNDAFSKIFGSNEVVINPQMSVDLSFGGKWNYSDNPVIAERYRTAFNFDFMAKMQFNITGSIGDRVKMNFNYNTEATFDFETNLKLEYAGHEDDILQKIEVGNVAFPLDGSLITGSQSLFGIKTDLRFGKLDVSAVVSNQRAQSQTVELVGGGQTSVFEISVDQYDANRHFFLSQYFRENYDKWLGRLPLILSGINIKRVEVWVTNKVGRFEETRNLVAFIDAGESNEIYNPMFSGVAGRFPDNKANNLFTVINRDNIRNLEDVTSYLTGAGLKSGEDFEKIENARKLLPTDYTVNTQLGYISLNTALNNDEVLAVAYEYEAYGQTFIVGELSTDGVVAPQALALKLLKGTNFSPQFPTWKLMMKNVYAIDNAYRINRDDFVMDVMYENAEAGTALPYISESAIAEKPLLRVLNLDNLNSQNDAIPDGLFDFVEGVTVLANRGRIIFPVLEPFGRYLEGKINDPAIAERYVYKELYDSTLTKAQSFAEKNKFRLVGSFQAESGSEIRLNAMNIPQGSVVVTAGGVKLVEGVDYEVNYMLGSVRILNRAYLESGVPLKVSLENQELFNLQTKTLVGTRLKYTFNDHFYVGGTLLHLSERPLTQKVNFGEEPISNTIWGLNTSFKTEVPWLTKAVDALPFLETKATSSFSVDAEFAHFLPGHSSAIGSNGAAFIDDFEGSQTSLDLHNYTAWTLASVPQGQPLLFPGGVLTTPQLASGFNRALLSWFNIYSDLVRNTSYTPAYMRAEAAKYQRNWYVAEIQINDLFPDREEIIGTPTNMSILNMTYFPDERGPYNYDTDIRSDGRLPNPEKRWGGMQRSLPITDFETANYDYIEFWLMDPFVYKPQSEGGKLYFNLGNISEDILRDGLKSFENGFAQPEDTARFIESVWGRVPKDQQITLTFDNNYANRIYQDIGYDGLDDGYERNFFSAYLTNLRSQLSAGAYQAFDSDPSGDNYRYYLDPYYDDVKATILDRYKYYNGTEGNSRPPEQTGGENTMNTPNPDMEDMNRDYTMNETESYYQYEIDLNPASLRVGSNYITDVRPLPARSDFEGPQTVNFYQFKIPISEGKAIGSISDFKSIRFVRMLLRGFKDTTVLRFASLELVRGEWRRYNQSLLDGQEGLAQPEMSNAGFDISAVNIEENSHRTPVNYILPPDASRQIDPGQYQVRQLNEQSMELRVAGLADGDARAAYKNVSFDFRRYRRLIMDVHAEAMLTSPLRDNELRVFIRIGSDYRYNYYEYEIPLTLTPEGFYSDNQRELVWPPNNKLDIDLEALTNAKLERNDYIRQYGGSISAVYERPDGRNNIRIVGNPNLSAVRTIMIGVRNPSKQKDSNDDGLEKSGVIWVNELRLSNFNESSGFAANARMAAKLADFGNISLSGNMQTPNFGSLESKINDRSTDYVYQYDLITNFEFGLFFPKSLGVRLPLFFGFSENFTNPQYYPFDQDILYNDAVGNVSSYERDSLRRLAQDYTRRLSVNATNVRIFANAMDAKVFSLANLYTSFSYNQLLSRNPRTDHRLEENYHFNLGYEYNVEPFYVEPFKKISWLRSPWLQLFRDFHFNPYPNKLRYNTDIHRTYRETQFRSIVAPDVIIPATVSKDFLWDANYYFFWDLTRSLSLEFDATNRARIDEPEGVINKRSDPEGYRHWHDSTWTNFWNLGRNIYYNQRINARWDVPLNKIPLLSWLTLNTSYNAGYQWEAAPLLNDDTYDPGNTISNSRNFAVTGSVSFESLYNKVPFLRQINDQFSGRSAKRPEMVEKVFESAKTRYTANRRRTVKHKLNTNDVRAQLFDANGNELQGKVDVLDKNTLGVTLDRDANAVTVRVTGRVPKKENPLNLAGKSAVRIAMMLRNISVMYNDAGSSRLPGFKPEAQVLGWGQTNNSWAPGWAFMLGWQDENFMDYARKRLWLSTDTTLINPYWMNRAQTWAVRATLEPWTDLRIEIDGRRSTAEDNTWYNVTTNGNQRQSTGNFSISIVSISTAFEPLNAENNYASKSFDNFLAARKTIAMRLAAGRKPFSSGTFSYNPSGVDADGYPMHYGQLSQEVLISAFLAAYTGQSAGRAGLSGFPKIPMPNWQINYTGLAKIKALKDIVTSFTIMHKYSSIYSVGSYMRNQAYTLEDDGFSYVRNTLNDFIAERDITLVSIREEMSPLLYIDVGWYNNLSTRVEWIKNRTLSLSLSNNQVTEIRTNEYRAGLGYTFREIPLIFRFAQNNSRNVKTNLRLRADLSIREDVTILRKITIGDDAIPQVSSGNYVFAINTSAEYMVSSNITARLFFDRTVTKPYVSHIPTANTNVGLSINISL